MLLGGHDREVIRWASHVLNKHFVEPASAFGIVDSNGNLRGAAIFNDFYPGGNIEMTYLGAGTITRSILKGIARYVFVECGASRLTAKTQQGNVLVRRLLPRLGFKLESTQPKYFGPTASEKALVFVMHRRAVPKWMVGD